MKTHHGALPRQHSASELAAVVLGLEYTIPENDGGNLALEYEKKKAFRCRKKLVYIPSYIFAKFFM